MAELTIHSIIDDAVKNKTNQDVVSLLAKNLRRLSKELDDAITENNIGKIGEISANLAIYNDIAQSLNSKMNNGTDINVI